jgi:uncharacterized repeat protein (TIGR01451 family)
MTGLVNIPVVLQNTATNVRLAVYTDTNGNYSFINVPDGNYRIVEAYRTPAVPSPGDFNNAIVGVIPAGTVPPINYASNPPPGATDLDCVLPNTILISVSGSDVSNRYIVNGPVKYIPIEARMDACAVISPDNLLDYADAGTLGTFPPGTAANTGVPIEPYPGVAPGFTYVLPDPSTYTPDDGEYTVQNIMTDAASNVLTGSWWRIADHTEGNETGRMMVINGHEPGSVFFTEHVAVEPHTDYLFSAWILNMFKITGYVEPALGVQILDQDGAPLYQETLGAQIPVNTDTPEWKQIGTVIHSYDNTNLTVQFLSEGPDAIGNDYAIDDMALEKIDIHFSAPHKTVSARTVAVGDTVTYTVTVHNSCTSPMTQLVLQDMLPEGLTLVADSVTVNGISQPGADPAVGVSLPDITGEDTVIIAFQAMAEFIPEVNPTANRAEISYGYTPLAGGIVETYQASSNSVPLRIHPPWCQILSVAFQRERNAATAIQGNAMLAFDQPLLPSEDVIYREDGTIDIVRRGTYFVFWFVTGMTGFATNGQSYHLKKMDYEAQDPDWTFLAGASNHVKISPTSGFGIVTVSAGDISEHGKATLALFNTADAAIQPTFFHPKAGILIFGADFDCLNSRVATTEQDTTDLNDEIQSIKDFLLVSEVSELWSETPELSGLGVAVIFSGYMFNFWGIGALDHQQTLNGGEAYYLMSSSQYPALALYQGELTFGTLWLEDPSGSVTQFPLRLDGSGIYFVPESQLIDLPAGTAFSFAKPLILVSPS